METIDGRTVRGMSIDGVRPLVLVRAGTSVTLGLRRESEDAVGPRPRLRYFSFFLQALQPLFRVCNLLKLLLGFVT